MSDRLPDYLAKSVRDWINDKGARPWGRLNVYTCEVCGADLFTNDRDIGVTPFMIKCREANCNGFARSHMYRIEWEKFFGQQPTHEWFRPETLDGQDDETVEHLVKGGLLLREVLT